MGKYITTVTVLPLDQLWLCPQLWAGCQEWPLSPRRDRWCWNLHRRSLVCTESLPSTRMQRMGWRLMKCGREREGNKRWFDECLCVCGVCNGDKQETECARYRDTPVLQEHEGSCFSLMVTWFPDSQGMKHSPHSCFHQRISEKERWQTHKQGENDIVELGWERRKKILDWKLHRKLDTFQCKAGTSFDQSSLALTIGLHMRSLSFQAGH